jgi:metallo-beta-lactamase class B
MLRRSFVALLPAAFLRAQDSTWDEPFPPHRIADNLYYVGSKGLASYPVFPI